MGVEFVTAKRLRELYNTSGIQAKVASGAFVEKNLTTSHIAKALPGLPFCTRSMTEGVYDNSMTLQAKVHYYLLPQGKGIGASGKKDPKIVLIEGTKYMLDPD